MLLHLIGGNLDFFAVLLYDQKNMGREIIHDALAFAGALRDVVLHRTEPNFDFSAALDASTSEALSYAAENPASGRYFAQKTIRELHLSRKELTPPLLYNQFLRRKNMKSLLSIRAITHDHRRLGPGDIPFAKEIDAELLQNNTNITILKRLARGGNRRKVKRL